MKKIINNQKKTDLPDIRPGDTVKVHQKLQEKDKERIQVFEGIVIARKHNKEIGATITVRKISSGIGVERIFPLHLPTIKKIEIVKRSKVRRAKLYFLRKVKGKKARLKRRAVKEEIGNKKEKKTSLSNQSLNQKPAEQQTETEKGLD